jgi:hypothetical protein
MLEYLLPYLPHELVVVGTAEFKDESTGVKIPIELKKILLGFDGDNFILSGRFNCVDIKPLLHPLNSFTKFEEVLDEMSDWEIQNLSEKLEFGVEPIDGYCGKINYKAVQTMFKNHLDVFNLIPKNLAIEIKQ